MNITVRVIDCLNGKGAEGVAVLLSDQLDEVCGCTDEKGRFNYVNGREVGFGRDTYRLELDIDAYFSTLGIIPFCRKIIVAFRLLDPAEEFKITTLITANSYVTYLAKDNG
jgi:5-hydroxyisourate hydrolase-like protein (transthyretin family)